MENVRLSQNRLGESREYAVEHIFQPNTYEWPGDWEGRALLAFCCHYEIDKSELPCMHELMKRLPVHTNEKLYFGKEFDGKTADEQQMSGHNWYLRGLLKYARDFNSSLAYEAAKSTAENLYLPMVDWYSHYPTVREQEGGVSGNRLREQNGWVLSTDVGCAFMCVDGMAYYYTETKDERIKAFLEKAIETFASIDYVKCNFQTHTTLTCARGVLKFYQATGEEKHLRLVEDIWENYVCYGMTMTYENFNWFGREDSWTEPCAVVDSLILSVELYKLTKEEKYRRYARRIWFNGLQFCQRENGGAGPNSCVTAGQVDLYVKMYEVPFCCTMRYAEGLLTYQENKDLFAWNKDAETTVDELGRRFMDDRLVVHFNGKEMPIPAGYELGKEEIENAVLRIIW